MREIKPNQNERDEVAELREEIATITAERKRELATRHDERINFRKLPPLAEMTRIQKRFFLEPWFTVGWVVTWIIGFVSLVLACFLPWHAEFGWSGAIWFAAGCAFAGAKLWHQDENKKLEPTVVPTDTRVRTNRGDFEPWDH